MRSSYRWSISVFKPNNISPHDNEIIRRGDMWNVKKGNAFESQDVPILDAYNISSA
jgi:hypothetical protein